MDAELGDATMIVYLVRGVAQVRKRRRQTFYNLLNMVSSSYKWEFAVNSWTGLDKAGHN